MMKKIMLVCQLILFCSCLAACTITQQELTVLDEATNQIGVVYQTVFVGGDHKILIDPGVSSEERKIYCQKSGIDEGSLLLYKTQYDVIINGDGQELIEMPIFDPSIYKNILAMSSSIPVIVKKNNFGKGYNYFLDATKFKKVDGSLTETKVLIQYVMSSTYYDYMAIPESSQVKSREVLKAENVRSEFCQTPIETLAFELREKLPKTSQNSMRELVKCYRQWIKKNIGYPDLSFDEDLRRLNYININDPLRTLELKMGVCEDNVRLLQAFLETQGISTECIVGYDGDANPGIVPHAVMGVILENGTYMIDPTAQTPNDSRVIEIEKDVFVSVGIETSDVNIDDTQRERVRLPMLPLYRGEGFSQEFFQFTRTQASVYHL